MAYRLTVLNTACIKVNRRFQREIELKSEFPFMRDAVRTGEGERTNTVAFS